MLSPHEVRPVVYAWTINVTLARPQVSEERMLWTARRRVEAAFCRLYCRSRRAAYHLER